MEVLFPHEREVALSSDYHTLNFPTLSASLALESRFNHRWVSPSSGAPFLPDACGCPSTVTFFQRCISLTEDGLVRVLGVPSAMLVSSAVAEHRTLRPHHRHIVSVASRDTCSTTLNLLAAGF